MMWSGTRLWVTCSWGMMIAQSSAVESSKLLNEARTPVAVIGVLHRRGVFGPKRYRCALSNRWCGREELNLHPRRDRDLNPARLPFRHAREVIQATRRASRL